jgi:hypothetical protein
MVQILIPRRLAARPLARRGFSDAAQVLAAALTAETKGRTGDPRVIAGIAADSGIVTAARGSADWAEELAGEAVSIAQGAFGSSRLWINSLLGRMDAIAGAQLP